MQNISILNKQNGFVFIKNIKTINKSQIEDLIMPVIKQSNQAKSLIIKSPFQFNKNDFQQIKLTVPHQQSQSQFQFDSNFQSGNLYQCFQSIENKSQYFLIIQNDTNTYGYNQWFFYKVINRKSGTLAFNLINMCKNSTMHKFGMKIAIFSEKNYKKNKVGWYQGGDNIHYYCNKLLKSNKENTCYYSLAFNHTFQQSDTTYFALNIPYTYTKMLNFINSKQQMFKSQNIVYSIKNIGYTHYCNLIPAIFINSIENNQQKKIILIIARQHPAQTVGSFIAEGIIQFLALNTFQTSSLLKKFIFLIIPMVNSDGVIQGHSRCNISGLDLNRQWSEDLIKEMSPETYYIKKYINSIHQKNSIQYFIDLHGHSKKMNSFFYGCKKQTKAETRLFSVIMSKLQVAFDMMSCSYGLNYDKQKTIRYLLYNMGIKNSFTLQTSYFGIQKNNSYQHFTIQQLKNIGKSLIISIFILTGDQIQIKKMYRFTRNQVLQDINTKIDQIQKQQFKCELQQSQSDPQGDFFPIQQRIKLVKQQQNKIVSFDNKQAKIALKPFILLRKKKNIGIQSFNKTFNKKNQKQIQTQSLDIQKNGMSSRHLTSIQLSTFYSKKVKTQNSSNQKQSLISKTLDSNKIFKIKQIKKIITKQENYEQQIPKQNSFRGIKHLLDKQKSKIIQKQLQLIHNQHNIFASQDSLKIHYRSKLKGKIYKKRPFELAKYFREQITAQTSSQQIRLINKLQTKEKQGDGRSVFYFYPIL